MFKPGVELVEKSLSAPVICPTFYSLSSDNYIMTQGPTGGPRVAEPLYRS
jgi:hypothetical protein